MVDTKSTMTPAILEALAVGSLPDVQWQHDDDLCDCTYQRIGMWKNPYLAETLEIRLCCIWAELAKQYPDMVRTIPGYYNENTKEWQTTPWEWDGESEMPRAIWYRHLAAKQDRPVAEIRAEYADKDYLRPRGSSRIPFFVYDKGDWVLVQLGFRCRQL